MGVTYSPDWELIVLRGTVQQVYALLVNIALVT